MTIPVIGDGYENGLQPYMDANIVLVAAPVKREVCVEVFAAGVRVCIEGSIVACPHCGSNNNWGIAVASASAIFVKIRLAKKFEAHPVFQKNVLDNRD